MDKITVIIPTYNREKTLLRSINSVLNQTYSNIEVIVIDDKSTDNTEKIINTINDNRLKYIKLKNNMGACYARNLGIQISSGEYIAFQDSDDEWNNEKLYKQLNFLKDNSYDVIGCSMNQIYNNSISKVFPNIDINSINFKEEIYTQNIFSTQTILGKRECFIKNQFDNSMPRFQDWDLMIRICQEYRVGLMSDKLVDAYIQEDSISKNPDKAIKAFTIMINKYEKQFKLVSRCYRNMGIYLLNLDEKKSYYYFKKAYDIEKNMKNRFNYMITKLKLHKILKCIYLVKENIEIKRMQ